ncbi:MAG TPA: hypothetical protein VEJ38_02965 [Candidatus Acidoferrales bacterium]|nr:hypothetical protein [Candidatus Acidoferrales bacterium]
MRILKTGIALVLGFVLGAWLFRTPTSKAAGGSVYVTAVPMVDKTVRAPVPDSDNVVGFSCVSSAGKSDQCYVLTR